MLRAVIDTNVLVAALRSRSGASNRLLRAVDGGRLDMLASVPIFLEYEAVLARAEHRRAAAIQLPEIGILLDRLADLVTPVKLHYRWRPQLADAADEMVLETAINGRADCIVTFNVRHFRPSVRFGIEVLTPALALGRL